MAKTDNPRSLPSRTRALFYADSSDPEDAREKLIDLRAAAIRRPNLKTFVKILREEFVKLPGIDGTLPQNVAAVFAAMDDVAEMMMKPHLAEHAYHNNAHTLVVTANRLMLGLVEHKMRLEAGYGDEGFSADELYRLARGCLICLNHDNGHNGYPNSINIPMEREAHSYGLLDSILDKYNFSDKEKKFIERVTLLTDPKLPGEILKFGASLHGFNDNILALPHDKLLEKISAVPYGEDREKLHDLLNAVINDPALVHEALLTKAADMAGSFGLSPEYWGLDGKNIMEEEAKAGITAPIDEHSMYKRQYWVLLNYVGAQRLPDDTVLPTFMHKVSDYLFRDIADDINSIINKELPEGIIEAVNNSLEKHIVRRGTPTALGITVEPNL